MCVVVAITLTGCATHYKANSPDFGPIRSVFVDKKSHEKGKIFSVKPGEQLISVRKYNATEQSEPFLIPEVSFKIFNADNPTAGTQLTFSAGEKYRIVYELTGHKDCKYAMGDMAQNLAVPFSCVGHDNMIKPRLLRQDWVNVFEMDYQKFNILPELVKVKQAKSQTVSQESAVAFDVDFVASVNGTLVFSIKDIDPNTNAVTKSSTATFKDSDSVIEIRELLFKVHLVDSHRLVVSLK